MFYAIDKFGNRVCVQDANKTDVYYCPVCKGKLRVREGKVNIKHFAHINKDCDDRWNYDMSEWHYSMQMRFPADQREVVVQYKGATHRADILFKDMVVEFQHSPISKGEIQERNRFYNNAGYKVAWVFDISNQYNEGRIEFPMRNDSKLIYKWKRPMRSLSAFPTLNEDDKNLVLFLYWIDEYGEECFNRVIWSSSDGCEFDFNFFRIRNYSSVEAEDNSPLNIADFFITEKDRLQDRLNRLKYRYEVKFCGFKGKPRSYYVCPKTQVFGLKAFGEKACRYCKYCGAVKFYGNKDFISYCCYPNQVNPIVEGHPGYDSQAPEFL